MEKSRRRKIEAMESVPGQHPGKKKLTSALGGGLGEVSTRTLPNLESRVTVQFEMKKN